MYQNNYWNRINIYFHMLIENPMKMGIICIKILKMQYQMILINMP